jgi:hypothetical protein
MSINTPAGPGPLPADPPHPGAWFWVRRSIELA